MPAVSAMKNFIHNVRQNRQEVLNLFDKILTYKYEIPTETYDYRYEAYPVAGWLVDVNGGVAIYFTYLKWFWEYPRNRFVLRLDHRDYEPDIPTYDISLLEVLNFGTIVEDIDLFYALNMFMNLITMQKDGLVDNIKVYRFSDRKEIAKEEWMHQYNQTIAVISEGKKIRG